MDDGDWSSNRLNEMIIMLKFGRKRAYTESQVATVNEMRSRGLGYRNISKSMGMSISMVRRILKLNDLINEK